MRLLAFCVWCLLLITAGIGYASSKQYIGRNTTLVVPPGVEQIELTYVDSDNNVIFKRTLSVKPEQKFIVHTK